MHMCRQSGKSLSFITRDDWRYARELCGILQEASQVDLRIIMHVCIQNIQCMLGSGYWRAQRAHSITALHGNLLIVMAVT